MKQSVLMFLAVLFISQAFGQSNKVTSTWNHLRHNELKQAKEAIDAAVEHEKTSKDAKAWYYRGNVYYALDTTSNESFASLAEAPKNVAMTSYEKALEYDENDRYKDKIQRIVINLGLQFFNEGATAYNKGNKLRKAEDTAAAKEQFQNSLMHFENYFLATELAGQYSRYLSSTLQKNNIDPNLTFLYAGYSANQLGQYDKAKKYLTELANQKSDRASVYITLSDVYLNQKDTTKALEILDKGQEVLPDEKSLQNRKLRIYQEAGRVDELIENLNASIKKNPEDLQLYRILASTYEKLSSQSREKGNDDKAKEYKDKARETYAKILEQDPNNFKANYNVGVMLYNFGVDKIKKSQEIDDYEKVMTLEERAKKDFDKAIPYLESAFRNNCADDNLFQSLKNIYSRTDHDDKLKKLKDAYNNRKVKVLVQGDAQEANINITHSGNTNTYKKVDLSTSWTVELCPFENQLDIKVQVPEGTPNSVIKVVRDGETVHESESAETSYTLK